jgi:hypothetical protein
MFDVVRIQTHSVGITVEGDVSSLQFVTECDVHMPFRENVSYVT